MKKKNSKMGKSVLGTLLAVSTGTALLFGYVRLVEKRSLRSWMMGKFIRLSGTKKALQEQPIERFEKFLREAESISNQPFEMPEKQVETEMQESWFEEMQVFTWNDQHDPKQRVILYLHGSGYVTPPIPFHFQGIDAIAQQTGAKIVFPIYPKAPRYTYADAYPKILALYRQILASVATPQSITLMGDSAGGGLSLGLAHLLKQKGLEQPKDIILFSPWLNAALDNPDILEYEPVDPLMSPWGLRKLGVIWAGGEQNLANPLVSPLYGDFKDLGKISLFIGTYEIFYPDVMKLDAILTEAGLPHNTIVQEKMTHDYTVQPIPEAVEAQRTVADIIMDA